MNTSLKRALSLFLALVMLLLILGSCASSNDNKVKEYETQKAFTLSRENLSKFSIVYSSSNNDYDKRAAEYVRDEIKARTGVRLDIVNDVNEKSTEYEIVIGETSRDISKALDASTEGLDFAILADDDQIALEGNQFVIAAAAYFFVENYLGEGDFSSEIPMSATVHQPIVKEAKNHIILIGDGMGVYQTKLFDHLDMPEDNDFSDGEDIFYGYMLPYHGFSRTDSISGTTDSAAGATALACGYKTINAYLGLNRQRKEVQSLTELALSLEKSAAILTTDVQTGATPGGFTVHVRDRDLTSEISKAQILMSKDTGTIIAGSLGGFTSADITTLENKVVNTIDKIDDNENGFFMMYEEAHVDKYSHNNEIDRTFLSIARFNQVIARIMEYAFYNPETFVLITADHETGSLTPNEAGVLSYHSENHSSADVPIFAFGYGAERFDGKTIENVQIPKTIANLWGVTSFGDKALPPALKN